MYNLEIMFRDSCNYKDFAKLTVGDEFDNILQDKKAGDEITIEELGYPVREFFNDVLGREYIEEYDHNILEIESVEKVTATKQLTQIQIDWITNHVADMFNDILINCHSEMDTEQPEDMTDEQDELFCSIKGELVSLIIEQIEQNP